MKKFQRAKPVADSPELAAETVERLFKRGGEWHDYAQFKDDITAATITLRGWHRGVDLNRATKWVERGLAMLVKQGVLRRNGRLYEANR